MFCTQCGAQVADDDTFCSTCGKQLHEPAPPASPEQHPHAPASEPADDAGLSTQRSSAPAPRKRPVVAIAAGVIVLIVALSAAAYFWLGASGPDNVEGNTSSNNMNGGFIAQQGRSVYYVSRDEEGGNTQLRKLPPNGKVSQAMDSEPHLSVIGDWAYFSSDKGVISKVRTNGRDMSKVVSRSGYCFDPIVAGDWVYYIGLDNDLHTEGVFRVRTDGTQEELLAQSAEEDFHDLSVVGDWVYYRVSTDEGSDSIWRLRADGTDAAEIASGEWLNELVVCDDWVYYVTRAQGTEEARSLYKARVDGSDTVELITGTDDNDLGLEGINVAGDWIYYVRTEYAPDGDLARHALHRMRVDGTGDATVATVAKGHAIERLNVAGDWLYFWDMTQEAETLRRVQTDGGKSQVVH